MLILDNHFFFFFVDPDALIYGRKRSFIRYIFNTAKVTLKGKVR